MKTQFERPGIFRPPSEGGDYFLALTSGCSNHSCTFCRYYGYKVQMRAIEEVKLEIDAMSLYKNRGIKLPGMCEEVYCLLQVWDGKRVFLQDGDALIYPFPRMEAALEYLNIKFPNLERIASYANPRGTLLRSVEELKILKKLKLGILYLGVESGDEDVLKNIGKGVGYQQIVEAGHSVKAAGIALSVTILLGLAGKHGSTKHAMSTAKIISEIDPDYCGALTLTLIPGTPLYEKAVAGKFEMVNPFETLEELKLIVQNSQLSNCFFSSTHASNYLTVRGTLSRDKGKILQQIETVLREKNPALLKPEYLRGL